MQLFHRPSPVSSIPPPKKTTKTPPKSPKIQNLKKRYPIVLKNPHRSCLCVCSLKPVEKAETGMSLVTMGALSVQLWPSEAISHRTSGLRGESTDSGAGQDTCAWGPHALVSQMPRCAHHSLTRISSQGLRTTSAESNRTQVGQYQHR